MVGRDRGERENNEEKVRQRDGKEGTRLHLLDALYELAFKLSHCVLETWDGVLRSRDQLTHLSARRRQPGWLRLLLAQRLDGFEAQNNDIIVRITTVYVWLLIKGVTYAMVQRMREKEWTRTKLK